MYLQFITVIRLINYNYINLIVFHAYCFIYFDLVQTAEKITKEYISHAQTAILMEESEETTVMIKNCDLTSDNILDAWLIV